MKVRVKVRVWAIVLALLLLFGIGAAVYFARAAYDAGYWDGRMAAHRGRHQE